MIHRRQLLAAGAGLVVTAPLKIPLTLITGALGSTAANPDVLAENGLAGSLELISAARENARAARVSDIDSTILIDQLSKAWARHPRALFGMTRSDVAVLVEALARDHGMAVVYRGWHDHRADGSIHHVLHGDAKAVAMLKRQFNSTGSFGKILGEQITVLTASGGPPESVNFEVATRRQPSGRARFVSWAVAPIEPPTAI
jgi:hypothetical protein